MNTIKNIGLLSLVLLLIGCAGTKTFHEAARAGDTIAVAAGWNHHFQRDNITVTVTDNAGTPTVYPAGDPKVRASINFYPDPLSSLVVSPATNQDLTPSARTYASLINVNSTANDLDWWETVVFVDLPDPMALGQATVTIDSVTGGETATSFLDIVPDENNQGTGGRPNTFAGSIGPVTFDLNNFQMQSMERVDHYTVSVTGATIPAAIELDFTRTTGVGQAYVVNPLGHKKSAVWSDDGTNLKVILMPARDGNVTDMKDYKFYVAGGITGLQFAGGGTTLLGAQAFDINGAPVAGVDATIN